MSCLNITFIKSDCPTKNTHTHPATLNHPSLIAAKACPGALVRQNPQEVPKMKRRRVVLYLDELLAQLQAPTTDNTAGDHDPGWTEGVDDLEPEDINDVALALQPRPVPATTAAAAATAEQKSPRRARQRRSPKRARLTAQRRGRLNMVPVAVQAVPRESARMGKERQLFKEALRKTLTSTSEHLQNLTRTLEAHLTDPGQAKDVSWLGPVFDSPSPLPRRFRCVGAREIRCEELSHSLDEHGPAALYFGLVQLPDKEAAAAFASLVTALTDDEFRLACPSEELMVFSAVALSEPLFNYLRSAPLRRLYLGGQGNWHHRPDRPFMPRAAVRHQTSGLVEFEFCMENGGGQQRQPTESKEGAGGERRVILHPVLGPMPKAVPESRKELWRLAKGEACPTDADFPRVSRAVSTDTVSPVLPSPRTGDVMATKHSAKVHCSLLGPQHRLPEGMGNLDVMNRVLFAKEAVCSPALLLPALRFVWACLPLPLDPRDMTHCCVPQTPAMATEDPRLAPCVGPHEGTSVPMAGERWRYIQPKWQDRSEIWNLLLLLHLNRVIHLCSTLHVGAGAHVLPATTSSSSSMSSSSALAATACPSAQSRARGEAQAGGSSSAVLSPGGLCNTGPWDHLLLDLLHPQLNLGALVRLDPTGRGLCALQDFKHQLDHQPNHWQLQYGSMLLALEDLRAMQRWLLLTQALLQ